MNLYFTVEFRTCLDLFSTSIGLRTCSSLICNARVQLRKISRRRSRSPKYPELGHFTLSFYRGRLRNVPRIITHVHSYCSAHLLFCGVLVAVVVCLRSIFFCGGGGGGIEGAHLINNKTLPTVSLLLFFVKYFTSTGRVKLHR